MAPSKSLQTDRYAAFLLLLRQAREEAGLTQAELGHAVGQSQTWVSKCELGERRVDIIELQDLANALRKPLSWFTAPRTDE